MVYLHTKLHMLSYNGSLVIDVKLQTRENIHTAAMLFFTFKQIFTYFSKI
jgi:hypothetical protein